MSDIIQFNRPTPLSTPSKSETLKDYFADHWLLQMTAEWRSFRAQCKTTGLTTSWQLDGAGWTITA